MKRVLTSDSESYFSCILFKAQTPNNVPDPPYLKNPGIPPFRLLEVDSVHYHNER